MNLQALTYWVVGLSFALYIGIAVWSRAGSTKEFYVAGGGVPPLANGMATAADWMTEWAHAGELQNATVVTNAYVDEKADTDLDGLPDWWEQAHFGGDADPAGDADGALARFRSVAETDPDSLAAAFGIDLPQVVEDRLGGLAWLDLGDVAFVDVDLDLERFHIDDR